MSRLMLIPEIDQIRESDERNYAISEAVLGSALELVNDTLALYTLFPTILNSTLPDSSPDAIAFAAHCIALTFAGACRYQFSMSVLSLMRARSTDGMIYLRRAVELSAFGALVKRHPHKASVWLNSAESEEAYRKYQEKFGNKALFPDDDPLLRSLYGRYDACSKIMHGSIFGISQHVRFVEGEARYSYGDIDTPDDGRLLVAFDYIIDTHHEILAVLAKAFGNNLASRLAEWEGPFRAVKQKHTSYRAKWKATIDRLRDTSAQHSR